MIAGPAVEASAALGSAPEVVVLVLEQDPRIFDCRFPISDCDFRFLKLEKAPWSQ
jgi:hypothetical protein